MLKCSKIKRSTVQLQLSASLDPDIQVIVQSWPPAPPDPLPPQKRKLNWQCSSILLTANVSAEVNVSSDSSSGVYVSYPHSFFPRSIKATAQRPQTKTTMTSPSSIQSRSVMDSTCPRYRKASTYAAEAAP